ncbi:endo-1,4-beta-xylanase [Butyrivibrio hungatei DSM 14810]|uniref:Beta-xylanase n=1 Tax=Butyrivibrio hungatei DSM 14810 TaxID=1121132 RepID=A0A1M7SGL8_9FIRM|nr:endo-1,4-beta-xylanase [Butyrivibrio hungatei]SHN57614.1 endo-1,4-beta-xylanase [Butyrivibrio hungatei DSM 14810]
MKKWGRSLANVCAVIMAISITACGETAGSEAVNASSETATNADDASSVSSSEPENQEKQELNTEESKEQIPALRDVVPKKMGCRIGCAITGKEPWDPKLWDLVTTHFNAVTLGNELKPDSLFGYSVSTCPGTKEAELNGETITVPVLNYSNPEKILNKILKWNEANPDRKIEVRGHVLLWHSQTPEWFFHEDYDKTKPYVSKEEMDKRLEWYIREVLTHFTGENSPYKDLFYGWDVVNEAISDSTGTYRTDTERPDEDLLEDRHGGNSSWWHVYQSEEFIINAFKYANKYAPDDLELYYNDYNECDAKKRAGIITLLEEVKAAEGPKGEGTRITAMGMQGHYSMEGPSYTEVEASAKAYGKVVGNVQITEWDLRATDGYDGSPEAMEKEYEEQRKVYNLMYYGLQSAQNSGVNITGITFWGTIDTLSWLQFRSNVGGGSQKEQKQCPLLFDGKYEPKPAFWVFAQE